MHAPEPSPSRPRPPGGVTGLAARSLRGVQENPLRPEGPDAEWKAQCVVGYLAGAKVDKCGHDWDGAPKRGIRAPGQVVALVRCARSALRIAVG